ncbi:uncharacterized protein [Henckelia pumila]|uniref:uncharacterized protein isoform X2 n=1 Tax=Henckelia pumila TaxID=405737 RepID=UPI003C6DD9BC
MKSPEIATHIALPAKRKRSLSSRVVSTPRVSARSGMTGRRSKSTARKASRRSSFTIEKPVKKDDDSTEDHPESSSSPETLNKLTQNTRYLQNSAAGEPSNNHTSDEGIENGSPWEGKADIWKALTCLVEAANRSKSSKYGAQGSVTKSPALQFHDSDELLNKAKNKEHRQKSKAQDENDYIPPESEKPKKQRRIRQKKAPNFGDATPLPRKPAGYLKIKLNLHSMTPNTKLKLGNDDDVTIDSNKMSLRQPTMNMKGKEKVGYAASEKSLEGNTMLETTDTKRKKTSRGRTHLDKLARRRVQGIRKMVRLNKLGQPVGDVAAEMQSYIGVLAREKVKISYKTWKQVPSAVKELIWESVNLTYDVDQSWKKGCLSSASSKWRQFKTHLTQTFILSKLDKLEELNEPPIGYGIAQNDWNSFVISRMSDDFIKLSEKQQERRKQNLYPHRLARKGYARYAEEIANELCDDVEINRAIIWKKGRVNKEGEFEGNALQLTVDKIDDYIQQKREGTLNMMGTKEDILTKALESYEHSGRVRAVGGHITPTLYFNVGRIRKSVDIDRDLIIEQKKELLETRKLISEQDARIQKLEAFVLKKGAWVSEIDDKSSCSVKLHQLNEPFLKTDNNLPNYEDLDNDEMEVVDKSVALQGKPVVLTLESSTEIVAYGTVVEVNGPDKLLYGVPLPLNCMRVSIDEALQKSARLPIPIIPYECELVGDVVGTHVAWPIHLIVLRHEKRQKKKTVHVENNQPLASSVPRSLRMLYYYCKHALRDGKKLPVLLDHGLFEDDYELNLHIDDIGPLYHFEPLSGNCVVAYMWHLYKNLVKEKKSDKFIFVNPHSIPYLQKTTEDKTGKIERLNLRASVLADRLSQASVNQLVLVPSNLGCHWILTVIEPYKETVYLLDSLSHRIRDEDWKYVVEMALGLFNSNKGRKGRKNVQWDVIQAPRQPDTKQCGYYVMKFMKQITEEVSSIERDSLRSIFTKAEYTMEEIDEVRSEVAECIQDHIYD